MFKYHLCLLANKLNKVFSNSKGRKWFQEQTAHRSFQRILFVFCLLFCIGIHVRVFVWKSVCLVVCFINRAKWKNEHLFVKNYLNDFAWCGKNALNREKLGDLCAEKRQTKFRYGHGSLIVLDWYGYDDGIDFFSFKMGF